MKGLITEREEVGQKNLLGCLSIVSFWATAAVQQPAFYIGILSALLSLLYTLPSILVSISPPFGTWPRGDKPHGDPRVPMSGYLPLMDGSKRTLFTDECRFSLRALSPPPHPSTYRLRTSSALLLADIPYLVTHISHLSDCSCPARLAFGFIRHIYPSC